MTSTITSVDEAVAALKAGESSWARTTLAQRRALLEQLRVATEAAAAEWVETALQIKGLAADSPLAGEEWISGPYAVLGGANGLAASLEKLEKGGSPLDGYKITAAPGGRTAIQVLPHGIFDHLLFSGFEVEVWSKPGVERPTLKALAGLGQRRPEETDGVCAVMGAGNIFSITPLDVLYQLFADNRVVVLKLNPITDPLLPILERIFAGFIDGGFVRILTGGVEIGQALTQHPDVTSVHMTGSSATHDAIVFGGGATGKKNKQAKTPVLAKPITSELGGVSPTIIVPGKWSKADLKFQAEHLVTQKLHNNGYNCVASQIAIVSSDWPQKDAFIEELRAAFDRAPSRADYYPGSADRVKAARSTYKSAERLGKDKSRTLVVGLKPTNTEKALGVEYFAPVLGVTELPGTGAGFLDAAVEAANTQFVGTLGVNIIARPNTIAELGDRFEQAIVNLRYGTIAVNAWTGVGYLTPQASWGAFPGHTIDDVQSGIGVVHNTLLIADPERTVVRGPFRPSPRTLINRELSIAPKPPWFVTNKTAGVTGRRLTYFASKPSWLKLPAIFASALRG